MGIGFFQVVDRAVHEVLLQLMPRADVAQVVRRSAAVRALDGERLDLCDGVVARLHVGAQCVHELLLQAAAQPEEFGVPFPGVVDADEPAVMQFVADVQRQLEITTVRFGVVGGLVE